MDELIGLFGVSEEDGGEHSYEAQLLTDASQHQVMPEVEEGNVEFKLKLVNPSAARLEHLVTQMKWRLREGHGEAIYQIGVEDHGAVLGLCESELNASLENVKLMASRLHADTTILREVIVDPGTNRKAVEVLVRKLPSDKPFIDMRVCVLGGIDAGKSTLVGVLTNRELDNGRGRARLNLFRHLHEMQTGHTSSVCHDILGFDTHGNAIDYSVVRSKEDICEASAKLITLIDLPGNQRSLKTTIFGLTGYYPDMALISIAANQGIVDATREHFGLALALNIPCVVLLTKCDLLSPAALDRLHQQIATLLGMPGVGKLALFVREPDDAVHAAAKLKHNDVTPIFSISCVTGAGIELLKAFLNLAPQRNDNLSTENDPSGSERADSFRGEDMEASQGGSEFKIDETYTVPNVGCVVGGVLCKGTIRRNDELSLGPYEDGSFRLVKVKSLHRSGRAPCSLVKPFEAAAIAIKPTYPVRKGMVLLGRDPESEDEDEDDGESEEDQLQLQSTSSDLKSRLSFDRSALKVERINKRFQACLEFETELLVLYHPTQIGVGFQCTLHIDNIVQTALIKSIVPNGASASASSRARNCNSESNSSSPTKAKQELKPDEASCGLSKSMDKPSAFPSGPTLSTNEKGKVTFRFQKYPEYVHAGMRILFREGKSKGIGHVISVTPFIAPTSNSE